MTPLPTAGRKALEQAITISTNLLDGSIRLLQELS